MELKEWTAAEVEASTGASPPTTAEWTPVEAGEPPARFAGADCVAYRIRFADPRSGDQTRALLTLRQLYARGRVWLNGDLLGTHDTYFVPAKFLFEPEPENELVVECLPPDDRFGGVHDTSAVPPETSVPAIRGGGDVEGVGPAAMTEFRVRPRLEDGRGVLAASVTVDAEQPFDDAVTFSLRPAGFRDSGAMEQTEASVSAGHVVTVDHEFVVEDPELWYPRDRGDPRRYQLTARFSDRELTRTTGFATVERSDDGLVVNGRTVRARGFNRLPGGDPERDVERAVEANANFIRAHAHVPGRRFHEAADEAGLLVFQDLPLTGPGGYDVDRGRELAELLYDRYAHHPSVAMFGVHDDPRELFGSPVGGGRSGRMRVRWRLWREGGYRAGTDESVAEAFPEDAHTFPVCGGLGTDPDAAHLYPGWKYGTPGDVEWLLGRDPGLGEVVTEFGAGALAADEEGAAVAEGEAAAAGFDPATHDAHVAGGVDESQRYQARTLKRVAEALRRHGTHAMAAFALRDTDSGAGMGVLARDGTSKVGFDAIADAYEPVQVTLDGRPSGSVGTTVVNDTGDAVAGEVAWTAGEESGSEDVEVGAFESAPGPTVTVPGDAETVELELSHDGGTVENRYRR